jgi:hypothetical protein
MQAFVAENYLNAATFMTDKEMRDRRWMKLSEDFIQGY